LQTAPAHRGIVAPWLGKRLRLRPRVPLRLMRTRSPRAPPSKLTGAAAPIRGW